MCKVCQYNDGKQSALLKEVKATGRIDCKMCKLVERIPDIKGVSSVYCYECVSLKTISKISGLKVLLCYNCPSLKRIPNIPGLRELDCDGNEALELIPNIKGLQRLSFEKCSPSLKHPTNFQVKSVRKGDGKWIWVNPSTTKLLDSFSLRNDLGKYQTQLDYM